MSIPKGNRAFPNPSCNGNVEDKPPHFLLSCRIYNEVRKKFLDFVFEKYPNVKLLDTRNLFNWLMINEDIEVLENSESLRRFASKPDPN